MTSATLPATTVVTNIPAPVYRGRETEIEHDYNEANQFFIMKSLSCLWCARLHLPNKAPTASPAVCGREKAAMALKMSGAPLPRARNVTPSAQTAVKENILH